MKRKTLFLGAPSAPFAAWPGCGDHRFCDLAGDRCCTAALEGLLPATLLLKSLTQLLVTLADGKGQEMSVKKEKRFFERILELLSASIYEIRPPIFKPTDVKCAIIAAAIPAYTYT